MFFLSAYTYHILTIHFLEIIEAEENQNAITTQCFIIQCTGLKTLVKAEQSPLACAMLVTSSVEQDKYKTLEGIANALHKAKRFSEAEQLLQ